MEFKDLDIKDIEVLDNIRQRELSDLAELMNSIKQHSLMQPIGVKKLPNSSKYALIWGFRRLRAFEKLGYKTIPARVFLTDDEEMTEDEFLILNASENIQRKSVNIVELGRIIHILKGLGLSRSEVAARLSISTDKVRTATDAFNKVPVKYRSRVISMDSHTKKHKAGKLSATITNQILGLRNITKKEREETFDWALESDKSVKDLDTLKSLLSSGMKFKKAKKEIDNWVSIDIRLPIKKVLYKELTKENNKISESIKQALIEKYGKSNFI